MCDLFDDFSNFDHLQRIRKLCLRYVPLQQILNHQLESLYRALLRIDGINRLAFPVVFFNDYFVTLISNRLEPGRLQYLVTVNQKYVPPQLPLATNPLFRLAIPRRLGLRPFSSII
jgi:hypothetical protein